VQDPGALLELLEGVPKSLGIHKITELLDVIKGLVPLSTPKSQISIIS